MVINFYNIVKKEKKTINPNYEQHGIKVPFRMCVAGPSGSGKTSAILNLILLFNKSFHEIVYCIKSGDEPLIRHLEDKVGATIHEGGYVPPLEDYSFIEPNTKKIKRKDKLQRLMIFDDLVLDKKANHIIKEYYIKCRKLGISVIYISQSYYQIPKMIRDNAQYFILGRNLLKRDLRSVLSLFPTEMNLQEFSSLYERLTKDDLNFLLIDIEKRIIAHNITGDKYKL